MIAALEYAASAPSKRVVNFSLSGDYSQAVEDAKQAVLDAGGVVVVAAGKNSRDACQFSANSRASISVGAVNEQDQAAGFSNWGTCVSVWAPGTHIRSAMIGGGDKGSAVLDGTSFAAPHVAGIVAMHLERGVLAKDMLSVLQEQGIANRLDLLGKDSTNLLVHMPLGLERVAAICPADMKGRSCKSAADCCDGYACEYMGLVFRRRGNCSKQPQRTTCTLRKSSGAKCLFDFRCCSRACEGRTCR